MRKLRYFSQNTRLAGHVFDFHGRPAAILRGRILALVMLLAYSWSFEFSLMAGVVTITLLIALAPWLFLKAQQFRLYNTSHRGLRFGFRTTIGSAYRMGLPPLLLWFGFILSAAAIASLKAMRFAVALAVFPVLIALLLPLFHHRLKAFQHRHARWGDRHFGFEPARWAFYKTYLKGLGVGVLAMILMMSGGAAIGYAISGRHANPMVMGVAFGILSGIVYLFVWCYMSVRLQQVVWRHTHVDAVRFDTQIRTMPLMRLVVVNMALTIITAGLYWPFASIALARYRITSMRMSMVTPLAWVDAGEDVRAGTALGYAATDSFGFDIGL